MKNFIRDMLEQSWTLLGMGCAYLVLEGSAKTITGYAIIGTTLLWAVTYPLRTAEDTQDIEE